MAATDPIHLAPIYPDDKPSPLSQKDSFLASFPGEPVVPKPQNRWLNALPTWDQLDTALWAAVPLLFHLITLGFLAGALFSQSPKQAYLHLVEKNGTGRLDYYILNSCVTPANSTTYICEPRAINVDFTPSISRILTSLPGYSAFKLPTFSSQTPAIFVSTFVLLFASFLIYLPLWILAYFPYAPLPSFLVRFYRYFSRKLFLLVGALAFVGFILSTTIGVGYKLFMMSFRDDFKLWYKYGVYGTRSTVLKWEVHLGEGYDLVWVASTFAGLTVIAINIALHNGLDERVEWGDQPGRRNH
ncbi:hypothetical protein JCM11641_007487 [Rhodosporidiobolus odoratus]